MATTVVVLVAVAVSAAVVAGGPSSPKSAVALDALVVSASKATLSQSTADLVLSGNLSLEGHTIPITGSGEASLSTPQQVAVNVSMALPGSTLQEKEVEAGGDLYLAIDAEGQDVSAVVPGKHWVELPIPVGAAGSLGTGTSDPLAQLQLLQAKGNTVTSLGTGVIDGVSASGYAVTISHANVVRAEQRFVSSSGLDATTRQEVAQAEEKLGTPTIDVWFDSSRLLRRISFSEHQTLDGSTVSVDLDMDFVHYGAPVSISTPSADDVVPFSQFEAAAQSAAGNAS